MKAEDLPEKDAGEDPSDLERAITEDSVDHVDWSKAQRAVFPNLRRPGDEE
jgi:hypothetical protein